MPRNKFGCLEAESGRRSEWFFNASGGLGSIGFQAFCHSTIDDSWRRESATRLHARQDYGNPGRFQRDISDPEEIGPPRAHESRVDYASTRGNTMHDAHRKAA